MKSYWDDRRVAEPIAEENSEIFSSLLKKHKLTLDEYLKLKKSLGRTPTFSELGVASAMWSEHCSYKSSRVHLRKFPTRNSEVIVPPGENAGVVRLHKNLAITFKMESHNHPSYIEPYQGAATGVGGILRDVFCMGSRPIANFNCLRFGEKSHPKTAYLQERIVKGIGDYGNCVGIPTLGGNISYDPSYNGNCLVNAMTVGLIHKDQVASGRVKDAGDLVVYVGSSTGRDGIHGATMASDKFSSLKTEERSTVQVGDPFTEKLLLEVTLELLQEKVVEGLQDLGAAGLTSSSFEMADRGKKGMILNLDLVPTRTDAMTAYEIMLSESQERMLFIIKESNFPKAQHIIEKWGLAYAVIGVVKEEQKITAYRNNVLEIDMPVNIMTDEAPKYERPYDVQLAVHESSAAFTPESNWIKNLHILIEQSENKSSIYHQYDHHIGFSTVYGPEEETASLQWIREEETKELPYLGLLTATACLERHCYLNPKIGSALSVLKCAKMISAVGGTPFAITDCLNFGNPENKEVMGSFVLSIEGISEACLKLNTPVVSGNVSFYNETDGEQIYPTPMIGMVGKMTDVRHASPGILCEKKFQELELYLLVDKKYEPNFSCSLLQKSFNKKPEGKLNPINWEFELEGMNFLRSEKFRNSKPLAIRDIGEGGLLFTLYKMIQKNNFGFQLDLNNIGAENLFSEGNHGYLIISTKTDLGLKHIGKSIPTKEIQIDNERFSLNAR